MKKITVLFFISLFAVSFLARAQTEIQSFVGSVSSPKYSPSGKFVLFSGTDYQSLFLLNLENKNIQEIFEGRNAGYAANFSQDGIFIAFKAISKDGMQTPCLFDRNKNEILELNAPSFFAGVPSFAKDGSVAFTAGKELFVLDKNLRLKNSFELPNYSNLAPLSPDGKFVAFNDDSDQIWIISLKDGKRNQVTKSDRGYFFPSWSPDWKKLALQSLSGNVWIFDLQSDRCYDLGPGGSVNWADSLHVIFMRYYWGSRFELKKTAPVFCDFQGKNAKIISGVREKEALFLNYQAVKHRLLFSSKNKLFLSTLKVNRREIDGSSSKVIPITNLKTPKDLPPVKFPARQKPDTPVANGFNAPYFHQVYDVPDWFNGHWACGATTALMGLQYYKILPDWPVNCSYPYAHQSSHGRYICEVYSFNGYTYNIGGDDPDGNTGYGGYGFIIQNNWSDTKGNMAKYARQHGVGSEVDWSPNFSKYSQNIKAAFPVVILNSLTTAGHYILGVGEIAALHTVTVNDPYGNKNQCYMNYNGKNVKYDWPGYSNGQANLNIVHCFIYFRQGADLTVSGLEIPDTLSAGQNVETEISVRNIGTKAADTSHVSVYLSLDKVLNGSDELLATISLPKIVSGDSDRVSVQVQLPDSLPSYKWSLIVKVDDENLILETDENNNLANAQFILKGFPRIFRTRPIANSTVDTDQPEISGYFSDPYFPVIVDSIKLYLDNVDCSDSLHVDGNKAIFQPASPLEHSEHHVRLEALNSAGNRAVAEWSFFVLSTDVAAQPQLKNKSFKLFQNYPNPFNAETKIRFEVPEVENVKIDIFSPDGSLVRQFQIPAVAPGQHSISWNGKDGHHRTVSSGIYFYRVYFGEISLTRRMIFLK